MAIPVAAAIVLAGLWVAGGLLSNDFRLSLALTAAWCGLVTVTSFVVRRRGPALRAGAVSAMVTLVLAGGYLAVSSMIDRTVDEALPSAPAVATGEFRSIAHETSGTAELVVTAEGPAIAFRDFRTDPGPDLQVYVGAGRLAAGSTDGMVRVGSLKGNVGNQVYALPDEVDASRGITVLVWCRAFSVPFGAATLETRASTQGGSRVSS